jgi:hypothetical protein
MLTGGRGTSQYIADQIGLMAQMQLMAQVQ